ncbi:DUF4221 domain-containing protein [Aquiflexum sp. LQ15W]|uniref:DUF4221 family protein n=1 Tax=Cognataquiflexum nitidum TaxID=2922272 RepID=UPI001F12CBC3|nr:DUF4221 family protein [Cognataquiflexum nitidum]MCH6197950.1 DUF4221 domain-containing protein [Cognataquiflexum nitidum]
MGKYYFLLLAVVFSCNSKESKSPEFISGELTEYISDTLYFEKDEFTKNLPAKFAYLEQNDSIFLYAWYDKRLLKYGYPSGELLSSTNFFAEGPDGIGSFISGSLITEDGLFFISDQKEIVHTDFEGKVVSRFPFPSVPEERLAANFSAMNGNDMTYDAATKTLFLADVPFVLQEPNMNYRDWLWKLDTRSGNFEPVGFNYPEKYSEHYDDPELGVFAHTYLKDQDIFVVNFPANDSLLILDSDKSYWVDGRSARTLTFEKGKTEPRGEWTVFNPSMKTSRYKFTQYDPYRKRLFRYVNIETKESEIETYTNESSFVVLDSEFGKVAELFFDNQEILPSGFFTPNGFYLKLVEQENDDKEGYVRIDLDL